MKLVVAIVHHDDANGVVDALLQREYRATRINSSGGFLRRSNATLLVGVDASAVDDVISVIRSHTRARADAASEPTGKPRRADLRPAVVFVVDLEGLVRV